VVRSGTRRAFPSTDDRWAAGCGDLLARQMDARHIRVWMRRHARALQRLRSSCQRIQPAPIRLCTVRHPKQYDGQLDTLTRCNGFGSGARPLGIYHFPRDATLFFFWRDERLPLVNSRQTCSQANQPECILPAQAGSSSAARCLLAMTAPHDAGAVPLCPDPLDA
jgi:hypothetical protein